MAIDWSRAHFVIACVGMADAWMRSFKADNTWLLQHLSPGASLVPFRAEGEGLATLQDAVFLADCIAFDHDMPTVVSPSPSAADTSVALVKPVVSSPAADDALWYFRAVVTALEMATDMRVGEAVELRYDDDHGNLTRFTERFAGRLQPLGLYAMAVRQIDILSEYLCLYRVLEWADQSNGKSFIRANLESIAEYDFGTLRTNSTLTEQIDVFETYRQRAMRRIDDFRTSGKSNDGIACALYKVRNRLAHGKTEDVALHDFGESVSEIVDVLPVVKMLARIAVEPPGTGRQPS